MSGRRCLEGTELSLGRGTVAGPGGGDGFVTVGSGEATLASVCFTTRNTEFNIQGGHCKEMATLPAALSRLSNGAWQMLVTAPSAPAPKQGQRYPRDPHGAQGSLGVFPVLGTASNIKIGKDRGVHSPLWLYEKRKEEGRERPACWCRPTRETALRAGLGSSLPGWPILSAGPPTRAALG